MSITTPTTAVRARELTASQREAVRLGYIINDYPYQPDRTYIIFDATVGTNVLHLATGASSNYSINPGNGTNKISYNDTGGTKNITYTVAGRYIITIEGNFQGIQVSGVQAERDKYIEIYAGSNYPSSIAVNAFYQAVNLQKITFNNVTSISSAAFRYCSSLENVSFPLATTFNDTCLANCESLINVHSPLLTTIANGVFDQNSMLRSITLNSVTAIGFNSFRDCINLHNIDLYSCASIGDNCFNGCVNLREMSLEYNASFSSGTTAMSGVKLSDLYVKNTNATGAGNIDAKLVASGLTKLNDYRLLY